MYEGEASAIPPEAGPEVGFSHMIRTDSRWSPPSACEDGGPSHMPRTIIADGLEDEGSLSEDAVTSPSIGATLKACVCSAVVGASTQSDTSEPLEKKIQNPTGSNHFRKTHRIS